MKIVNLFSLFFLMILSIYSEGNNHFTESNNHSVIISGKILNYSPENNLLGLKINKLACESKRLNVYIDSTGNFRSVFDALVSTNAFLIYKDTRFNIIVHPGDSIHVELNSKDKSIKFYGSSAKNNNDLLKFEKMNNSIDLMNYWAVNPSHEPEKYLKNLDSVKNLCYDSYNKFITENTPNEETKIWAKVEIESNYYYNVRAFPFANNINSNKWQIPKSFLDAFDRMIPMHEMMTINTSGLNLLINNYRMLLIQKHNQSESEKNISNIVTEGAETDSLLINALVTGSSDSLLSQMIVAKHFAESLEKLQLSFFEINKNQFEKYIRLPFLKDSLLKLYSEVKEQIENPMILSKAILKRVEKASIKETINNILAINKGKIIYIDIWATWCEPCIGEFPYSEKLMEKYNKDDVSFIFLCIDSEEKIWKAMLNKYLFGGQHYFLNIKQSVELTTIFQINGIPKYILVDKNGVIVSNNAPRPSHITDEIEKLLVVEKGL